jgi:hypothetical protein
MLNDEDVTDIPKPNNLFMLHVRCILVCVVQELHFTQHLLKYAGIFYRVGRFVFVIRNIMLMHIIPHISIVISFSKLSHILESHLCSYQMHFPDLPWRNRV